MDKLNDRMKRRNTNLHSESSNRMSQRPLAVKSGEGVGYQDIGSSFGPSKPTATHVKVSKNKSNPGSALPSKPRGRRPNPIAGDTSDDELLLSSSQASDYTPQPLPLPSPLGKKSISRESTFPNLSPLSSTKDKGKARETAAGVDEVDSTRRRKKRGVHKPLAGINRSPSPTARILKATKRASDDSSGEQGRTSKKRKNSRPRILDYPNEPSMGLEDDSLDLGYARDPSKICPYCDEELPSHPTSFLQSLLMTARKKSRADPRPRNPRGLKAPLTIYISVCQRHRFESHQLPIASERGWPKTIDFAKVPGRVRAMKKQLEAIIMDNDDISDVEDIDVNDTSRGPRSRSVFWRDVKKEVKKQGSRTAMGVKGQFASFEKTQPGYYGEQGSVIIHQTLFDLFPPSSFDTSLITPLVPAEFIQRILVPEAAVRLIAQDLCADMEDAIVTLRESAQYGVAMFPDTSESKRKGTHANDEEMGVADQIMMERARVRRKELEEEERVEEEMLEEERAAQRAKARESRKQKALERAKQVRQTKGTTEEYTADTSELSEADATPRTRKKATRSAADSDDAVEVISDTKDKVSVRRSRKISGFASLTNEDHESTPRPSRQQTSIAQAELSGKSTKRGTHSEARLLPLQVARNRAASSTANHNDGWSRSLRSNIPDDGDSDTSHASQRSQRLVRPRQQPGGSNSWLWSDSSTPTSD